MATINGTNNADTKYGTSSADTISGLGGNDTLYGRAGNDIIRGGTGGDKIWGEAGNDSMYGDDGDDFIYGGDGNDVVLGGIGNDTLYGDAGTDTVRGDAGNDTIKGGTGISYLYGGDGNDQIHYNPTTSNISSVGSYLDDSLIYGGTGYDTLYLTNQATYTSGKTTKPAGTSINIGNDNVAQLSFEDPSYWNSIEVGKVREVEKIIVGGSAPLDFISHYGSGAGVDVTGTAYADSFYSSIRSDTMRGGAGNDTFEILGGNDVVTGTTSDADTINVYTQYSANLTVTGFNGEGAYGGDRLYFHDSFDPTTVSFSVTETAGKTVFALHGQNYYDYYSTTINVTVDKVGLEEGVDWFFV